MYINDYYTYTIIKIYRDFVIKSVIENNFSNSIYSFAFRKEEIKIEAAALKLLQPGVAEPPWLIIRRNVLNKNDIGRRYLNKY